MPDAGFFNPSELIAHVTVRPNMQVADFGCGSGETTMALAHLVGPRGAVTAIDVLPSALESVQVKATSANLANIKTIRANLEVIGSSGLPEGSQDFVFLSNILWQSPKKPSVLTEAARVLKQGGMLVALEWEPGKTSLGPPQEARVKKEELQTLVVEVGMVCKNFFPAGDFHYGLIAQK